MRHSARLEAKGVPNRSAQVALETPTSLSPRLLQEQTPPYIPSRNLQSRNKSPSTAVDPIALSAALQDTQHFTRPREATPGGESPIRKRPRTVGGGGDRFLPARSNQNLHDVYSLHQKDASPAPVGRSKSKVSTRELHVQKTQEANRTFSNVLRNEMFDEPPQQAGPMVYKTKTPPSAAPTIVPASTLTPSTPHKSLFQYSSPHLTPSVTPRSYSRSERGPDVTSDIYSLSPVKYTSQRMLLSPRKSPRAVNKVPYKVLDAPLLADDFYLNLVDWGSQNVLAVGLGADVYLWNAENGKVETLVNLEGDQTVTSVSWIQRGTHLAVGTSRGLINVYDPVTKRKLRMMTGHTARVSSMSWNAHILSTGSRDRSILHRDVRSPVQYESRLVGHKQEVCGLRWNPDTGQLASGGNDNKIFIWDGLSQSWLHRWGEAEGGHRAAVKAIAWSPHQRGLLASGGGTADRCIKFWNTISTSQNAANSAVANGTSGINNLPTLSTMTSSSALTPTGLGAFNATARAESDPQLTNPNLLCSHDTGSQVCNLLFSTLTSELVSTHGYSQHAINIWKYPSMSQVCSLTGHTYRVLYLSMSPSGDTIVTGAGDETLRFWDVFSSKAKEKEKRRGNGGLVREWATIR